MDTYFKNVLFIGPQYKGERGGMASVLGVYSKSIKHFNFIAAYHNKNTVYNIFYFINAVFKILGKLISDSNIKVVHVHSASRGSFIRKSIIILIAKLFRKKTVLHIHGGEFKIFYKNSGKLQFLIRYVLDKTDELACLSEEWKNYFDSITKKQKSVVLNNPVILPAGIIKKIPALPVKVLFLNHINPKKGIFDIIEFFKQNKSWLSGSFKLIVAGAGESDALEKTISENNLGDIIEYKGWVSGKEKESLVQNSDVFILTSYNEGLPMSILESMSFGKPVIATNVGGIPRIVRPGENGWLVQPGDITALATVFEQIKCDKSLLEKYGNRSLQIVQDYSPEKVNEQLNEIYNSLLQPYTANPIV